MEWFAKIATQTKMNEPLVTLEGGVAVPRRVTLEFTGTEHNGVVDPDATFVFEFRGETPVCTSAHIRSSKRGGGVQNGHLHMLDLDKLMRNAFLEHAWRPMESAVEGEHAYAAPVIPVHDLELRQVEEIARSKSNMLTRKESAIRDGVNMIVAADAELRARSRSGDAELREVARVYLADWAGKPTAAVAEAFGMTWRTASRRVRAARDLGLIPEPDATAEAYERARAALESTADGGESE